MIDVCYMDTEFRKSNYRDMEIIVCCVRDNGLPGGHKEWKIYLPEEKENFIEYIAQLQKPICCWAASAEARTLLSLGIDIRKYKWFDGMVALKLLTNGNPNQMHHYSQVEACRQFGVPYTADKILHVSSILDGTWEKNPKEIVKYCIEDVTTLEKLCEEIWKLCESRGIGLPAIFHHSKWAAYLAIVSREGIPIDDTMLNTLCSRAYLLKNSVIYKCCTTVFPFYSLDEKGYHLKDKRLARYIQNNGLGEKWPKTPTGKYMTDGDTLKQYGDKTILDFLRLKDIATQIRWFEGEPNEDWSQHYNKEEGLLHCYFNDSGTVTGRNAPPARQFLPAMSSWLRCLIRPQKGKVIIGIDYSSQEYAIAASYSHDTTMKEGYLTGDPYFYWAQVIGAIPNPLPEGKVKSDYKAVRALYKAITLGLQYGIGATSLSKHIAIQTGTACTVTAAKHFIELHKNTYTSYWRFLRELQRRCEASPNLPIKLKDGWNLWPEGVKKNTIRNFPIQGTGASILKIATMKAIEEGLSVVFPLHDAIYIICDETEVVEQQEKLKGIMMRTAKLFIEDLEIRTDVSVYTHDRYWVEEKGEEYFKYFAPKLGWDYEETKDTAGKKHFKRR